MTDHKIYHFSRWEDAEEAVGRTFKVGWDKSKYWKDKLTFNWVQAPQITLPNNIFLGDTSLAQIGERITQFSTHLKYASELLKEYIFDEIRGDEFPSLPSRRKCLFGFPMSLDPIEYARSMGINLEHYKLLILRINEDCTIHWADMNKLNVNLSAYEEIANSAREYWGGVDESLDSAEALVDGMITLEEIVNLE